MKIPNWFELIVLGIAAWRIFQLLAFDTILDKPRHKLLKLGDWQEGDDTLPDDYRLNWAIFLTCPYCAGAWIATGWWIFFQITSHWSMVVASLVALWALPVAGHKLLAREEDK